MPLSRKKACLSCRRSKLRCNRLVPTCSRCMERSLPCIYENQRLELDSEDSTPHTPQTEILRSRSKSLHHQRQYHEVGNAEYTGNVESLDTQMQHDSFDYLPVNQDTFTDTQLDFSPMLPATDKGPLVPGAMNLTLIENEPSTSGPWFLDPEAAIAPSALISPGSINAPSLVQPSERALVQKQEVKGRMLSAVVLGQLTSHPKMMTEGDRLPPFIHPPCHVDGKLAPECREKGSHQCLPGDLAMCQSLVNMYYSRSGGNTKFVWRLVYAEHDRIRAEYYQYDLPTRVKAIQALLVFLLMQAEDTSTIRENDTNGLLDTVLRMTIETSREKMECYYAFPTGVPDREDWVLLESIRRIITMLLVVSQLLHGVFIFPCTGDSREENEIFTGHPVPCERDLWEARTSTSWRIAFKRWIAERRANKLLTVGDVLGAAEAGTAWEVRADVMRWCQNLDGAGMLIWTVLPLHRAMSSSQAT